MNKRMKKKAIKTMKLTRKERLKSQGKTIHMLLVEKEQLEKIIDTKNDTILMLKEKLCTTGKEVASNTVILEATEEELKEFKKLYNIERTQASQLYVDRDSLEEKLRRYMELYAEQVALTKHWREALAKATTELDSERAKPLWKKVLRG